MPKTRKFTARRPTSHRRKHHRNRRSDETLGELRTQPTHRPKPEQTGNSPAALRIHITKIWDRYRFFITSDSGGTIVTSSLYPNAEAAKTALIYLLSSVQADDFETFDHT